MPPTPSTSLRAAANGTSRTSRFVFTCDNFHLGVPADAAPATAASAVAGIIAYLLLGGVTFALRRLGIGMALAGRFLIAAGRHEAPSLRRWKLARRKFEQVGVVVADDLEMAERRFFDGWVARDERPASAYTPPPPPPSPFSVPPATDIVGLFPQPQARP